ncbi:hypothetical protein L2E82_29858 [Cichorium intybus]|uniref:Uncharacterized protein n=1 Tax=Cichorium intybus TaxID=13427 RepID=A0ACB9CYS1_CICIN|nr:hypothetical protein L2E82_29858 [Cichorium intybus]
MEGRKNISLLTYFISYYGAGAAKVLSAAAKESGLSVAYLSGRQSPSGLLYETYSQDDIDALRALAEEPEIIDIFLTYPSYLFHELLQFVLNHVEDRNVETLLEVLKAFLSLFNICSFTRFRRNWNSQFHSVARLDIALYYTVRTAIERSYEDLNNAKLEVGAKSRNIAYLKGKVPSWVGIPTSVCLPFGSVEKVLSN